MKDLSWFCCSIHGQQCVVLSRPEMEVSIVVKDDTVTEISSEQASSWKRLIRGRACGYMGTISHNDGKHANYFSLFVKAAQTVGVFNHLQICRITEIVIVINHGAQASIRCNATGYEAPEKWRNLAELGKLISNGLYFFAYDTLSHKYHDLSKAFDVSRGQGKHRNYFKWNHGMTKSWRQSNIDMSRWVCPVINGSIETQTLQFTANVLWPRDTPKDEIIAILRSHTHEQLGASNSDWERNVSVNVRILLISRLSWRRAGTRFQVRGVNDEGFVANFVETEQVLFSNGILSSFTQLRGSVPIFWSQPFVTLTSHRIRIDRNISCSEYPMRRHFGGLVRHYGSICIIDLLSRKKDEGILGKHYQELTMKMKAKLPIEKFNYDFNSLFNCYNHEESMWTKLRGLQKRISKQHFFVGILNEGRFEIIHTQTGVVRVNCLDCLDRTNGMQMAISNLIVERQLNAMGIYGVSSATLSRINNAMDSMWIANGHSCSLNYAGTSALEKSKSSVTSFIHDTRVSIQRAFVNNFMDDVRNLAISLLCSTNQPAVLHCEQMNSHLNPRLLPSVVHTSSSVPTELITNLLSVSSRYSDWRDLTISVGTWNVAGGCQRVQSEEMWFNSNILDWLLNSSQKYPQYAVNSETFSSDRKNPDIVVIGLQEMVDLTKAILMKASSLQMKIWGASITKLLRKEANYVLTSSCSLVGICLFVFVKRSLLGHVKAVSMSEVKTGLGGVAGNKGAVAISMNIFATSLCFVCSHLASGQSPTNLNQRNRDYADIVGGLQFDKGRALFSHDVVIWLGDLNYRIDLTCEQTKMLAKRSDFAKLCAHDQLLKARERKDAFWAFKEAPIKFLPTYKYDFFTNLYDSSEKNRIPAYTDRILWWQNAANTNEAGPIRQLYYGRVESTISDHRPVFATFALRAKSINISKLHCAFKQLLQDARHGQITAKYAVTATAEVWADPTYLHSQVVSVLPPVAFYHYYGDTGLFTLGYNKTNSKLQSHIQLSSLTLELKEENSKELLCINENVLASLRQLAEDDPTTLDLTKDDNPTSSSFSLIDFDAPTVSSQDKDSPRLLDFNSQLSLPMVQSPVQKTMPVIPERPKTRPRMDQLSTFDEKQTLNDYFGGLEFPTTSTAVNRAPTLSAREWSSSKTSDSFNQGLSGRLLSLSDLNTDPIPEVKRSTSSREVRSTRDCPPQSKDQVLDNLFFGNNLFEN